MSNEVVILAGPPAAGKTTVAELLATSASVPTVHLTTDLFYRSIRTGFVLPFLPEAQRQNEVVVKAVVGTVAAFACGGYDVVVEGIVGPWFLPPFRALAERDQLTLSYVVLRPDLDTTLARAKGRGGSELRDVHAINKSASPHKCALTGRCCAGEWRLARSCGPGLLHQVGAATR